MLARGGQGAQVQPEGSLPRAPQGKPNGPYETPFLKSCCLQNKASFRQTKGTSSLVCQETPKLAHPAGPQEDHAVTCGFVMVVAMSYGALHGPVPSGFAQKKPGLDEVRACPTPSHRLPPRAGLHTTGQASTTQASSQRANEPPACHAEQDAVRYSRRERPGQGKLADIHMQQGWGCRGER